MEKDLLLIAIYCMVDDFMKQPNIVSQLHRTGRPPKLPDEALVTLALFQDFSGIKDEDEYWSYVWRKYSDYFPGQHIDRSVYNRRKKNFEALVCSLRRSVAKRLGNPTELHIIDCIGTSAMTVTKFFGSQGFPNAGLGYCASKKLPYAEYKTATIVTPLGVIEDYVVDSASPHDAVYGEALLLRQGSGQYLGDKGFIFKEEIRQALNTKDISLITPKRSNMLQTTTRAERKLLKKYRRVVETVNGQLTEHFHYDKPGGKSERGILSRICYKLAAHTIGLAILRMFNLPPVRLDLIVGV